MAELEFSVINIAAEAYAAAPQLTARLRISESSGTVIHAMALRCQVKVEAQRRGYSRDEETGLLELFGGRERWPNTLKPLLWMQSGTMVQGFTGTTDVDLPLPCSFDFEVAAAKYLNALRDGTVPLEFLFSGTVFLRGGAAGFGVELIPWDRETRYAMPVAVWRALMDAFFPNQGWIRLDRDVLAALARYKAVHGLISWEAAIEGLLAGAGEPVP
jgi:hypothetical protein